MSNGKADDEKEGNYSPYPDVDEFWIKYGKDSIKQTIKVLDERAKYMVTTCASLIVINFGLLTAFPTTLVSIKVSPQFFFAVSAALFALSFFPVEKTINLQAPYINRSAYNSWRSFKRKWQKYGFVFFIAGLLAMAITTMIDNDPMRKAALQKSSTVNTTMPKLPNATASFITTSLTKNLPKIPPLL